MKKRINKHYLGVTLMMTTAISWSNNTVAINLSGTAFDRAASHYKLDPLLVYAVALTESAYGRGNGVISPWQWSLRGPDGPFYGHNAHETRLKFEEFRHLYGKQFDVGMMQISLHWNGDRVPSLESLLDNNTNLMTGAQVLHEAISSSPGDLQLGIGRYHHWEDEDRARHYGSRVIAIWQNLKNLKHQE